MQPVIVGVLQKGIAQPQVTPELKPFLIHIIHAHTAPRDAVVAPEIAWAMMQEGKRKAVCHIFPPHATAHKISVPSTDNTLLHLRHAFYKIYRLAGLKIKLCRQTGVIADDLDKASLGEVRERLVIGD